MFTTVALALYTMTHIKFVAGILDPEEGKLFW